LLALARAPGCAQKEVRMAVADEFVQANQKYASAFTKGELPLPPARKVPVVVCMAARIDPARTPGGKA
jgi:carbonic anhydrase